MAERSVVCSPFHRCFRFSRTTLQNVIKDLERGVVCGVLFFDFSCGVKLLQDAMLYEPSGCRVWALATRESISSSLSLPFSLSSSSLPSSHRGHCKEYVADCLCVPSARASWQHVWDFRMDASQQRKYGSTISLQCRNHVEIHLKLYKEHQPIPCPDPECQKLNVVLDGQMHFISHAAQAQH